MNGKPTAVTCPEKANVLRCKKNNKLGDSYVNS